MGYRKKRKEARTSLGAAALAADDWKRRDRNRWSKIRDELRKEKDDGDYDEDDELSTKKLRAQIKRAEPMLEQITAHYKMFIAGLERQPPDTLRAQLDQIMTMLMYMQKPTAALKFKYENLVNKYVIYRDRWDKTMQDIESGKVQRRGPEVERLKGTRKFRA